MTEFPELATVGFLDRIGREVLGCSRLPESGILFNFPDTSDAPPALLCIHEDTLPSSEESEKVIMDMIDGTRPIQHKIQAVGIKLDMDMKGRLLQLNSFQVYKSRFRIVLIIFTYEALPGDFKALADLLHGNMLSFHPAFFYDSNGASARTLPPSVGNNANPYAAPPSEETQVSSPKPRVPVSNVSNGIPRSTPVRIEVAPNTGSNDLIHRQTTGVSNFNNSVNGVPAKSNTVGTVDRLNGSWNDSTPVTVADSMYGPQRQNSNAVARPGPYSTADRYSRTNESYIIPISKLGLYMPKWKIQGRVTNKSGIKTYGTSTHPDGQVFSIEILDKSGEIRGSFFSKAVDKFFNRLILNRVYTFADGQIKPKRQQFNPSSHMYEIMFSENSIIEEVAEQSDIPRMTYDFIPLREIADKEVNSKVDILAVVTDFKEIDQITRKDGQKTEKRDIVLLDETGMSVVMSLWGEKTALLPIEVLHTHPVICIKGARVSDWRGRKLDTQSLTSIETTPTDARAVQLKDWYTRAGKSIVPESLGNSMEPLASCKTIEEIIKETANSDPSILTEKGVYFTCKAYIDRINQERFSYPACAECRRKVTEDNSGSSGNWQCNKCGKIVQEPMHTYNLMMSIVDSTGSLRCSCWNDCGEVLMGGWKAAALIELQNSDDDEQRKLYTDAFMDTNFSEFVFNIRAKSETYMDETRTKYMIIRAKSAVSRIKEDTSELIRMLKA